VQIPTSPSIQVLPTKLPTLSGHILRCILLDDGTDRLTGVECGLYQNARRTHRILSCESLRPPDVSLSYFVQVSLCFVRCFLRGFLRSTPIAVSEAVKFLCLGYFRIAGDTSLNTKFCRISMSASAIMRKIGARGEGWPGMLTGRVGVRAGVVM